MDVDACFATAGTTPFFSNTDSATGQGSAGDGDGEDYRDYEEAPGDSECAAPGYEDREPEVDELWNGFLGKTYGFHRSKESRAYWYMRELLEEIEAGDGGVAR